MYVVDSNTHFDQSRPSDGLLRAIGLEDAGRTRIKLGKIGEYPMMRWIILPQRRRTFRLHFEAPYWLYITQGRSPSPYFSVVFPNAVMSSPFHLSDSRSRSFEEDMSSDSNFEHLCSEDGQSTSHDTNYWYGKHYLAFRLAKVIVHEARPGTSPCELDVCYLQENHPRASAADVQVSHSRSSQNDWRPSRTLIASLKSMVLGLREATRTLANVEAVLSGLILPVLECEHVSIEWTTIRTWTF